MRATVIRSGSLAGELFIECSHRPDGVHESLLRFAVPVATPLPVGTEVEITCEVVELPAVQTEPPQGDVTAVTVAPLVVPDSPIVGEEAPPLVDTAPSGQEESNVQSEDNAAVS